MLNTPKSESVAQADDQNPLYIYQQSRIKALENMTNTSTRDKLTM